MAGKVLRDTLINLPRRPPLATAFLLPPSTSHFPSLPPLLPLLPYFLQFQSAHKLLHLKPAELSKKSSLKFRRKCALLSLSLTLSLSLSLSLSLAAQTAVAHKSYALSNRSAPIVAQNICTTHESPDQTRPDRSRPRQT